VWFGLYWVELRLEWPWGKKRSFRGGRDRYQKIGMHTYRVDFLESRTETPHTGEKGGGGVGGGGPKNSGKGVRGVRRHRERRAVSRR